MIVGGVIGTMVFRLLLFPLPGGDPPPTRPEISSLSVGQQSQQSFLGLLARSEETPSFRNIDCETGNGRGESYCAHDWCSSQPAVNMWQYIIGICLVAVTNAFCQGLVQTLFNKILGPKPQVTTSLRFRLKYTLGLG